MKVIVDVLPGMNTRGLEEFLTNFRFDDITFLIQEEREGASLVKTSSTYTITAIDGETLAETAEIGLLVGSESSSTLVFMSGVKHSGEPKVIFATDHSDRAAQNLERFKRLRPAGFAGAVVVSDAEYTNIGTSLNERSQTFLERIKRAAQSTQANVIIANFDLESPGRKSAKAETLAALVQQTNCHVLILKAY